jgi:NodT family efflux transporter outer membrane factor (OMF) lipoprotein
MPRKLQKISAVLLAGLLGACAVGPNYKTPPAPKTSGFVAPDALPATTASTSGTGGEAQQFVQNLDIPGQWWTLFQSPTLNALIERGLANSPTLASAQASLRQAKETVAAERGSFFPSLSGSVQATRQSEPGASLGLPQIGSLVYTLDSATLSVSYTLDAFGGIRRQVEALGAQAEYEQFSLEAAYLTLTTNIVSAAINEASLRAQIDANEKIAASQQRQLDITQRRVTAGGASRADVLQQQATLQTTLAQLPTLRGQLAQQRNLLAAYVGDMPADYAGPVFTLDSLHLPTDLPLSLPSKFVEQRPDVREYAALLHESTAQIGVATANMLPQITLTGSYGSEAGSFGGLFGTGTSLWSVAGGLTQPLFKGGQLLHQRRAAVAAAEEADANYRSTVITAFQNVSDALYALSADAEALAAQDLAERTAAESLKLVQAQYQSGAASYLQVLTSEQSYQNAEVALVKARAQRFADTAALFQALGGGWWNRSDVADNSAACCKRHM